MYDAVLKHCDIHVENVNKMTEEEFAMSRRNGIGASDMSAILGTMDKFRTASDVLMNKLETTYTDEERAIGKKPAVKKGKDLEPLILQKAEAILKADVVKLTESFKLKQFPYLTINYDGLVRLDQVVPVEAKVVTTYGDKYYIFGDEIDVKPALLYDPGSDRLTNLKELAKHHGIPSYYLVQLQQQMMGVGSSYGYLAALRDKTWTLHLFKIPAYNWIQDWIKTEGYLFWQKVEKARRI